MLNKLLKNLIKEPRLRGFNEYTSLQKSCQHLRKTDQKFDNRVMKKIGELANKYE